MRHEEKAVLAAQLAATLLQPSLEKYGIGTPRIESDASAALDLASKLIENALLKYGVR